MVVWLSECSARVLQGHRCGGMVVRLSKCSARALHGHWCGGIPLRSTQVFVVGRTQVEILCVTRGRGTGTIEGCKCRWGGTQGSTLFPVSKLQRVNFSSPTPTNRVSSRDTSIAAMGAARGSSNNSFSLVTKFHTLMSPFWYATTRREESFVN
jgi:hypothetical protein